MTDKRDTGSAALHDDDLDAVTGGTSGTGKTLSATLLGKRTGADPADTQDRTLVTAIGQTGGGD